jgi:hypothetical protein
LAIDDQLAAPELQFRGRGGFGGGFGHG